MSRRPAWLSFLEALARPGSRRESDVSAVAEHNCRGHALGLPAGLELQWLGTAGFRLSYEGHTILIDPYFSRPTLGRVLSRSTLPSRSEPESVVLPSVDAILVGHTHFDHALDVPPLAKRHGCRTYGSSSLDRLMRLHSLDDLSVRVETGRTYPIGPFEVSFVPSQHSKLLLGMKVPAAGELTCETLDGLNGSAYRCGEVYGIHVAVAGRSFYHQGSANLVDEAVVHRDVDYFLCGISGRGFTDRYLERILTRLEPRIVIPTHYDNFFVPLDEEIDFLTNVDVGGFVDEVGEVSRSFQIRSLDLLQTVTG
jgi:L-ascorbate metabolism protein UlaG (beta-lactamase superfamily)